MTNNETAASAVPPASAQERDIIAAVDEAIPSVVEDLKELIRIPSISAIPNNPDVDASARCTARLLQNIGGQVDIIQAGGAPAVIAHFEPENSAVSGPRVLLYAHHDVQPTGDENNWVTGPFDPQIREGRLYARGSADDKGGFGVHLAALQAFQGKPPVPVTVFVEGEEEIGSPSLLNFLEQYKERLSSDVIIICDSGNWDVGAPGLTVSLRGVTGCVVEVSTIDKGVHSGLFGGPVPDSLTALSRIIATLHDKDGNVAVEGIPDCIPPANTPHYSDERIKAEAGVLNGVDLIGEGPRAAQLWYRASINVLAIESPSLDKASNTIIPSAKAKISLRVPPGTSAHDALEALERHIMNHVDWPVKVSVHREEEGNPFLIDTSGQRTQLMKDALSQAWGTPAAELGMGGSIPFISEFAKTYPEASILVTAVGDPHSAAHGPNESLHMGDFTHAAQAEALFLHKIAHSTQ